MEPHRCPLPTHSDSTLVFLLNTALNVFYSVWWLAASCFFPLFGSTNSYALLLFIPHGFMHSPSPSSSCCRPSHSSTSSCSLIHCTENDLERITWVLWGRRFIPFLLFGSVAITMRKLFKRTQLYIKDFFLECLLWIMRNVWTNYYFMSSMK